MNPKLYKAAQLHTCNDLYWKTNQDWISTLKKVWEKIALPELSEVKDNDYPYDKGIFVKYMHPTILLLDESHQVLMWTM